MSSAPEGRLASGGRVEHLAMDMLRLRAGSRPSGDIHAVHECVYVLDGEYRARAGEQELVARPSEAVVYPAGTHHRAHGEPDGSTRLLILQWRPADGDPFPAVPLLLRDFGGRLLYPLSRMLSLTPAGDADEEALREALLGAFLGECRLLLSARASRTEDPITRFLRSVDDLVPLQGAISLEEMAALVGMRPTHFGRAFRARTGTTPMQYLQRLRVQSALPLICHTELPLATVAARVGLCSASYLWRLVSAHTGRSPRDLRAESLGRLRGRPERHVPDRQPYQ